MTSAGPRALFGLGPPRIGHNPQARSPEAARPEDKGGREATRPLPPCAALGDRRFPQPVRRGARRALFLSLPRSARARRARRPPRDAARRRLRHLRGRSGRSGRSRESARAAGVRAPQPFAPARGDPPLSAAPGVQGRERGRSPGPRATLRSESRRRGQVRALRWRAGVPLGVCLRSWVTAGTKLPKLDFRHCG